MLAGSCCSMPGRQDEDVVAGYATQLAAVLAG